MDDGEEPEMEEDDDEEDPVEDNLHEPGESEILEETAGALRQPTPLLHDPP
jgi:hypothetical protein